MPIKDFWIVWNPTGPSNPTVRFETEAAAKEAADVMSECHFPEAFWVMKAVGYAVCTRENHWHALPKGKR